MSSISDAGQAISSTMDPMDLQLIPPDMKAVKMASKIADIFVKAVQNNATFVPADPESSKIKQAVVNVLDKDVNKAYVSKEKITDLCFFQFAGPKVSQEDRAKLARIEGKIEETIEGAFTQIFMQAPLSMPRSPVEQEDLDDAYAYSPDELVYAAADFAVPASDVGESAPMPPRRVLESINDLHINSTPDSREYLAPVVDQAQADEAASHYTAEDVVNGYLIPDMNAQQDLGIGGMDSPVSSPASLDTAIGSSSPSQ